ncbi:MAG: hypothetical protein KME31_21595 [Tolypothrix carrinoi HA7290-LM1]|jgi:hypothetical protein|nr:hypothetical protein [Tolypothrix carrinoi HA7290-LM1]
MQLKTELVQAIAALDKNKLQAEFQDQNELLVVENFLPNIILDELLAVLPFLKKAINRNYISNSKKGGSISREERSSLVFVFVFR